MGKDQSKFESEVFAGRWFSNIQKYLRAIRKSSSIPPIVNYANTSARTDQLKAELFNSFFQKVYSNKVNYKPAVLRRKLNSLHITEKLITDISSKIQLNKSNGPDNFGNIIFNFCSTTLSKSLVLLFQTMSNKGKFPSIGKISQITPIYKEGSKAEVNCYRPISLLCCASKILGKVTFDEIYYHCRHRLYENQFGFRMNRSATTQLLLDLDTVYRKFDTISSDDISILYLDFAKAFDKVPHHFLIKKLESFDAGGNILLLLHSYLEDRKQFVKIGK